MGFGLRAKFCARRPPGDVGGSEIRLDEMLPYDKIRLDVRDE